MTPDEKERLFEGVGYEKDSAVADVPVHYIAHKLNFTLANCTLALVSDNKEILVMTVTHFLSSIEMRPKGKAFKISARTESFVVEGSSVENDLVPILTADNVTSGSNVPHVFALDFEKSPLQVKASYGLTISAEPMEVVYHKHAINELMKFLELPKVAMIEMKKAASQKLSALAEISRASLVSALKTHKTMHLNIDLKSPYFVVPEHGSLQQTGSVIVLDMGRLTVNSDLQPDISLQEDATKMEVEERLYDRFTIALSDTQVLFSDSGKRGDEWRVAKQAAESDMHLVPKTRVVVVFSNSIKPDYKTLPRQKLNVSIPALKLSLSDRRVSMLCEFVQNVKFPKQMMSSPTATEDAIDAKMLMSSPSDDDLCMHTIMEPTVEELKLIRRSLHDQQDAISCKHSRSSTEASIHGTLERSHSASEASDDEECEYWARVIDLPGFEDNVSASNWIKILLRFSIGEIALHLARSSDHVDRPYLMLRAEKLCIDAAMMQFGPAFQASLHQIQLVDKLHPSSSGEYLELISSSGKTDMLSILYRKVQANCPEFKSHFHQVEHSLVVDLSTLSISFHREAFLTLAKFLQYVWAKLKPKSGGPGQSMLSFSSIPNPSALMLQDGQDPPVPPGATKFSISARLNAVNIRLCDTDLKLADLKVVGLECDYVLKANEKSVLRLDLASISLEDLMEETLYSKVLSTEEDKVFDIKLVKNSPHHKEIETKKDVLPMKVDGSVRIRFGRVIVVLVQSFMNEFQRFFEPFFHETAHFVRKSTGYKLHQQVANFQKSGDKYQLSIDIHAPTFLLPQKATSPNSLVISLGDLGIENFFHEVPSISGNSMHFIDNILIRLSALQMSSAVILLDGKMEIREPILEPLKLRLDIKRALIPFDKGNLLYEVNGSMDVIKVNIGQRDLSTMIAIYQDNYSQMQRIHFAKVVSSPISPIGSDTPSSEDSMRKLEVFLYTASDVYKERNFTFIMEGMNITLYNDGEELRSSAVRDPDQILSCFNLDEVKLSFEMCNDKAFEMRCSCQSATLIDSLADQHSPLRKIFQSYSGDSQAATGVLGISLSMPPMVDLTYRQTNLGDASVDVVVEKTRLNVSMSYILAVAKFVSDALPGKQCEGYLCEDHLGEYKKKQDCARQRRRLPSDSTSGYHSTASAPEDAKSLSISAVFRKPEIVLFANPMSLNSEVVVVKMDLAFDYSFNMGQGNLIFSVSGLHVLSCIYGRRKQTICVVLHPCELEFSRMQKIAEAEVKMHASLSCINLCLSAPIIHTIIEVTQELIATAEKEESKKNYVFDPEQHQKADLWSPTSVTSQKWTDLIGNSTYENTPFVIPKFAESFTLSAPEIQIFCEVSGATCRIPVLYTKFCFEAEVNDWSSQLNVKGELQLEAMYYNEEICSWEPLLEHVMVSEGKYRPLEILFKAFRGCSHPVVCPHNNKDWSFDTLDCVGAHAPSLEPSSSSSGDETEEGDSVTVIKNKHTSKMKRVSSIAKSRDSSSFLAYPPDSDSENEDGMLEKIASTFDHLFSDGEGDSEDEDLSEDSEGIADVDAKSDSGETETADHDVSVDDRPVFAVPHKDQTESIDVIDGSYVTEPALYITIDSRDTVNWNISPVAISVIQEVINDFSSKVLERTAFSCKTQKGLMLKNQLGPESTIKLLKKGDGDSYEVLDEANGGVLSTSITNADLVAPLVDISPPDSDSEMSGDETDTFRISTALVLSKKRDLECVSFFKEPEISDLYKETTKEKLSIEVDGFEKLVCLIPKRSPCSMFALQPIKNKTRYFVMVANEVLHGQRTLSVLSPLKIENHLPRSVHILCQKSILEALGTNPEEYSKNPFQDKYIRLVTLDSGAAYNVPLYVAYHCKLFVQPAASSTDNNEYKISSDGIWWQDVTVSQKNSKFLSCSNFEKDQRKFCCKVVCNVNKDVRAPFIVTKLVPNYTLHLYPTVVVHNVLPFAIALHSKKTDDVLKLAEGENACLLDLDPQKPQEMTLEVIQYLGIQWHGKLQLSGDLEEHHPVLMGPETDTCGGNRHLSIHVHSTSVERNVDVYLFSPYWVVNKTGLPLQFRGSSSDLTYEMMSAIEPLLFRFKKHRRKKAKLRIYSSQWSKSFSLDTVGNTGVVMCTDRERNKKYKFLITIDTSELLLTKIITIKPCFLVINNTQKNLRFMEKNDSTDLWFDIAPEKCIPFWPDTDSMKMFLKHRDSKVVSQNFYIAKPHLTVLRMEHGSALCVEVKGGESQPITVTFFPFTQGDAPVSIENLCEDVFLKIHQKCQGQVTLLNPYKSVLYTWDDPTQERTLIWNLYNRKKCGFPAHIFKDGYGHEKVSFHSLRKKLQPSSSLKSSMEESSTDEDDSESEDGVLLPKKTRKDKVVVYWVSYMEKNQRVLMFTQDDRIAREARKTVDGEKSDLEFFFSLSNLGISLINGAQLELAYISFTSCPAIWEIEINSTWKLLTLELSAWLEDKWVHDFQKAHLKDYLQVDLTKMQMIKPFFGHLRRFYSPAIWLQLRKSEYHLYLHSKIHRFQVDNQLPDAIFPTVIYPGPTPQSVVRRSGPRPCLDCCVLVHKSKDQSTLTVKYLKVLAQEMHVRLDKGFLLSVHDVYTNLKTNEDEALKLKNDLAAMQAPLCNQQLSPAKKKYILEYVHLSPVKIQLSLSPRGTVHKYNPDPWSVQSDIIDFLVNSIGATITEVKDVELKMAFFEKKGITSASSELMSEIKSHYKSQLVQQMYVLVLGLDILGNPYGLVKDFTQGLGDFFYEPFMGSVNSPDEFADSLARGAQSLFGHIIGGSSGAVSLITGSFGQAFSVLTFDDEYKKKRQLRLQMHPDSLPGTLLYAAKGFVLGVALGLSGVLVQPITGAQQEGVEGFFRGIGKGLLGLITKPAGGVMDLVSMAFDGIRRAAELGENVVVRIRLPRYINPSVGLRPYSPYQASGSRLLQLLSKGHYADSDIYWAHAALSKEERADVALITDKHMFLLEKCRFWGGWDIEWAIPIDDVMTVPFVSNNNMVIKVKQEDSILNFAGDERYIRCEDEKVLLWLKDKMEKLLVFNMREKPCPTDV